ncbi:MAG TPA: hypothetical protein VGI03_14350 [Verrucomicrobiae bacterium]|jgi:hypothetical protein
MKRICVPILILTALGLSCASAQTVTNLADWTFETSVPASAGPFNPEIGSGSASGSHASGSAVYSNPAGDGSSHSFSSNFWGVNDYYQFSTTLDLADFTYSSFTLSYDQNGSSTGPGTFYLAYSTDGTTYIKFGSDYTLTSGITWNAGTPGQATIESDDLSSIAALDTASTVYFRLVDDSSTAINGSGVGTSGSDRVDNFSISATVVPITPSPEPTTLAFALLGGVAGILALQRRK